MDDRVEATLPPGVHVKTNHFLGMNDPESMLVVQNGRFRKHGHSHREAGAVALYISLRRNASRSSLRRRREAARRSALLRYSAGPVTIELPKEFAVESLPKNADIPLPKNALYTSSYKVKNNIYTQKRSVYSGECFLSAERVRHAERLLSEGRFTGPGASHLEDGGRGNWAMTHSRKLNWIFCLGCMVAVPAHAGASFPDWVSQAASTKLPTLPSETKAVELLR